MFKTARLLTAIAVAAVALPAAAQTTDAPKAKADTPTQDKVIERTGNETRPTASKTTMTPEQKAADKAAKRAEAKKPATTQHDVILERTGNETRQTASKTTMTPEQKAADKAAKRTGMTREEQEKALKQSPGS